MTAEILPFRPRPTDPPLDEGQEKHFRDVVAEHLLRRDEREKLLADHALRMLRHNSVPPQGRSNRVPKKPGRRYD